MEHFVDFFLVDFQFLKNNFYKLFYVGYYIDLAPIGLAIKRFLNLNKQIDTKVILVSKTEPVPQELLTDIQLYRASINNLNIIN